MAGEIGLWISFLSASPNELAAKLKMVEREMTEIKAENRLLRNRLAKFESDKNWVSKDTIDDESTGNNKVAGEKKKAKDPGRLDMIGDATLSIMMVTSGRAASSLDLQLGRIKKIRSTVLTMQARKVDKSSSKNPCAVIQGAIIKKRGQKMPQAKVPLPPT
eukprot:CAMPEP_0206387404 /NCGR_PEP_ID=MMETSP0294-20121207/16589_1 /ASSEMBLY_ACC=CAM_ASM_000327 /TAXON_ID=39354 /ORGANISM="Heterosigma akashiwo, Strain CCMP2393" /LENGTH=160 /DNA_ID=CAMNT_0053838777 /DNA_START=182 /DNA_END=662 /DNA_ORIENTATION=-